MYFDNEEKKFVKKIRGETSLPLWNDLLPENMTRVARIESLTVDKSCLESGEFIWLDNTSMNYTNWHVGEPNGRLSTMCAWLLDGKWDDTDCESKDRVYLI